LACFSTGVFACKRNAITFDEWMQLEALRKLDSKLFGTFFDMPLMNYWVHSKWQRGEMKVAVSDLQHIWGHQGKAELEQDCVGSGWHFPTTIRRPARGAFLWAQAIHS